MRRATKSSWTVMKDPIEPSHCARQMSALAAPERLRIIRYLRDGPHNVTEIAAMLRTPPVNVAHHMRVLRDAGIARGRKRGRFVYYSLAPGFVQCEPDAGKEFLNLGCCRLEVPRGDEAAG
jgi:DNA-binding transcriptional ArsR family regulator